MTKAIRVVHTYDEQLQLWEEGESVHVDASGHGIECCPDFSCCHPDLLAPIEVRREFRHARPRERERLLMSFLGGAIANHTSQKVHVTNGDPEDPS
jgi:hypothetical protein